MSTVSQHQLDQLHQLGELRRAGTITDAELAALKDQVLRRDDVEGPDATGPSPAAPAPHGGAPTPVGPPPRRLPQYQMMTPRAPLAPGAGVRVYPVVRRPAGSAPRWAPDPTGRHQHRWWGGNRWTDEVADDGVRSTDPLDPDPPS